VTPTDGDGSGRSPLEVRIISGGATDAAEEAAIVAAVTRVIADRERRRSLPGSAWAAAGRLEGTDGRTIRSRVTLRSGPV
jgi:hypothetical protein